MTRRHPGWAEHDPMELFIKPLEVSVAILVVDFTIKDAPLASPA
jgi:hypothetical protein